MNADYRLADPSLYVFSGFSVSEIKSLGNFPDYAKLSGVLLPTAASGFGVVTAMPRPYRPFRWPYFQTMALQKMDPDYWIELESTYRERIVQRRELVAAHGKDILYSLPGSELACKELMEMVVQFLCARYPQLFERIDMNFVNHILDTTYDLTAAEPLQFILDNVPEDFAIMLRDEETGRYCLQAGVVCSTIGWTLSDKMGLSAAEIHQPVPDYKERLEPSIDRFFSKMPAAAPIQWASWGLEIGKPLFLPATHPSFSGRDVPNSDVSVEDVSLRVDWQTLRRLPLSGAVVFNFKALFTPVSSFKDEPCIPALLLKILNEGKESIMRYKGVGHVKNAVKPALEMYERHQVERGMVRRGWEPRTLNEYPFYPGWTDGYPSQASQCEDRR
ncbi:hypothetical protein LMH87_011044 [Akanthomyces muscarius]|uniref:Uncharacterized protein n=1 Tax=Akanthomyces muscarius TaxID=2231603 RepID=A0A9W8QAJ0_AKAMU|nr:hypothetical protein LMH87_011044 [Akanthomyces muscarius]KAJ4150287.1 hypothetical protein LMH87_011044 [Akanthomyces muscarius]